MILLAVIMASTMPAAAKGTKTAPPLPDGLVEMALGSPDAPVTMVEYASLTCPHCADFALDRLPALKKKYIDTGQVRLLYRDYPLDGYALRAAMISRCAGPEHYFAYVDAIFSQQREWLGDDPLEGLKNVARTSGMSDSAIDTCLANEALSKKIVAGMQSGTQALDFHSTPTFLIDGIVVSGALPLQQFEALIDTALIDAGVIKR
jgi:protein-disulfide isomerase